MNGAGVFGILAVMAADMLQAEDNIARESNNPELATRLKVAEEFHRNCVKHKIEFMQLYQADGTPRGDQGSDITLSLLWA